VERHQSAYGLRFVGFAGPNMSPAIYISGRQLDKTLELHAEL